MIKATIRFFSCLSLCAMLVYAPEILHAVSAPYQITVPERVLLRILLCCAEEEAASSVNSYLTGFQKAHPSVHLRVTRAHEQQLLSLQPPFPDVMIFPESADAQLSFPIIYCGQILPSGSAQSLLVSIPGNADEPDTALALAAYLHESAPAPTPLGDF